MIVSMPLPLNSSTAPVFSKKKKGCRRNLAAVMEQIEERTEGVKKLAADLIHGKNFQEKWVWMWLPPVVPMKRKCLKAKNCQKN